MENRILIMGLVFLLLFSSVYPISLGYNIKISDKIIQSNYRGTTLYVGGSGQDNYTNIQDAIDNASDGDTVFVYDDSSPYYENVIINKSINLIGEDRKTTIIDGIYSSDDEINVLNDKVTISGFTITNFNDSIGGGLCIYANQTIISNNIIKNTIRIIGRYSKYLQFNEIYDNIISSKTGFGIKTDYCNNSIIINNTISNNKYHGLILFCSYNNLISENIISWNYLGVGLFFSSNNEIYKNNITNNQDHGITTESCANKILNNNFIDNVKGNAVFSCYIFRLKRNTWDCNYWNEPMSKPYLILGYIYFNPFSPSIFIRWFPQIDWHPAKEPYDILKTLTIWVSKSPIYEGETLTVKVYTGPQPVSDVSVTLGQETAKTDANGEVTFTMPDPGVDSAIYIIKAEKKGYITEEKSITVLKLPTISFVADYIENTITVVSFSPSNFSWGDIEITGDCNISGLGENVTVGDKITDCHEVIKIIFIPLDLFIAEFNFSDD